MRRARLAIDLLIIGGLLVFGSIFAPGGSMGEGEIGNGGWIVPLPLQRLEAFYMFRGQCLKGEFWTNSTIDVYVMDRTQYKAYLENHSTIALVSYENTTTLAFEFKPKKSGQYFMVVERIGPPTETITFDYKYLCSGLNANFLQPGIIFTISGIGLVIVGLFQKNEERIVSLFLSARTSVF